VAERAPAEMVNAEIESRELERLGGSTNHGGLDLSQEGRISLPTTPAALSWLGLAYREAAVSICGDAALAAAGGGGRAAGGIPLCTEAQARGYLGSRLVMIAEERQRGLELLRQSVALLRHNLRRAPPGFAALEAKRVLACWLVIWGARWMPLARSKRRKSRRACARRSN